MKRILLLCLAFVLLCPTAFSVSAATDSSPKEEVVYGLLNLDGSVNNLYVVNIFNGGSITDYGSYSDIRNLTTSEKLSQSGDQITTNTDAAKFYYQGTLEKKELPWNIDIKYYLDDKEISGTELAGKNGKLNMRISVKKDDNLNSVFFENYALQIGITLDNKLCTNIITDNATIAEAGGKKQLSYTVLPGKEVDISLSADVRDFEMEAVTINGIKLILDIPVDNDEFSDQFAELADAIKGLDDGSAELLIGLTQLSTGMQKYMDGMKAFKDGLGQLSSGAEQLNTGAAALKNGLFELTKQNDSLINGALAIQQATFDSVNAMLLEKGLGLPILTPDNYSTILSSIPDLAPVKSQLDGAVQFTQGLKGYTNGVAQLGAGANDLANGTAQFKSSSSVIASSANELYNAGAELNAGIKKLRDGLASYKNGTKRLREGTSDMSSEIDSKIDEMIGSISGSDEKVVSFVSDKNTNVAAVQFVLKTDAINLPEDQKAAPPKEVELNLWQKLLKLFGL